jgi:hypothetical protein
MGFNLGFKGLNTFKFIRHPISCCDFVIHCVVTCCLLVRLISSYCPGAKLVTTTSSSEELEAKEGRMVRINSNATVKLSIATCQMLRYDASMATECRNYE